MWTSVPPYSFIIKILLFSLPVSVTGSVVEDRAVVRIEKKVLFVSDLNKISACISTMRCAKGDSLLLKSFGLNGGKRVRLTVDDKGISVHSRWIERVVAMVKVQDYAMTRGNSPGGVLKDWGGGKLDKCLKKYQVSRLDFAPFIHAEALLRRRIQSSSGGGGDDAKSAKNAAIAEFVGTIAARAKHRLMYNISSK